MNITTQKAIGMYTPTSRLMCSPDGQTVYLYQTRATKADTWTTHVDLTKHQDDDQ